MFEWPGEKIVLKLLDMFEKGIGVGARPWQIKRDAAARAEARRTELLAAAAAMNEAEDIRARRRVLISSGGKLLTGPFASNTPPDVSASSLPNVIELVAADGIAADLERLARLQTIAVYAQEEAERLGDENVSDEPVDPEWFVHWRSHAEKASHEDLQRLWARVAAGEARKPGSFGYRTLSFLAAMSHRDAAAIEALAPFIVDGVCLLNVFENIYGRNNLDVRTLLHLSDIGIIGSVVTQLGPQHYWETARGASDPYVTITNNGLVLVLYADGERRLTIPAAYLSEVGEQVLAFVDAKPSVDLLKALAEKAREQGFPRAQLGTYQKGSDRITDVVAI